MTLRAIHDPMRVLVIAPSRHAIREPHSGGLEAAVWDRVRSFRADGHEVTLVAAEGSDFLDRTPPWMHLPAVVWGMERPSDEAYPHGYVERVGAVLTTVIDHLVAHPGDFDLIDNHSLHPLPIARSGDHGIPMLTTLHTPPLPELVDAANAAGPAHSFVAVSAHTAEEWAQHGVDASVHANEVDGDSWPLGDGGHDLVWFGRIVPEKGTHLAIEAARIAGRDLVVAGRIVDVDYHERFVAPRIGRRVRHFGALRREHLAPLIGASACALVTPRWEEPFGLVTIEALATGTPVAAFDRGGVAEVVRGLPGTRLVAPDDVEALAAAALELAATPMHARLEIRRRTLERFASRVRHPRLVALFQQRMAGGRDISAAAS